MADLQQFSRNIRALADRIDRRAPLLQRKCAAAILREVIMATPVGNKNIWLQPQKAHVSYVGGRARANWSVGLGSANTTVTENIDAGGQATIDAGDAAINSASRGDIHLNNNLPYIIPLNEGHSHQAPIGFIETAVQNGVAAVHGFRVTEEQ